MSTQVTITRKDWEDYCKRWSDREDKCYIADVLDREEPLTLAEIAYYADIGLDRCARLCLEMMEYGELVYIGEGRYTTCDKVED